MFGANVLNASEGFRRRPSKGDLSMTVDSRSPFRQKLGYIKMRTVDAARVRVLEARAGRRRKAQRHAIGQLAPIECVREAEFHVRMLCGHRDADMGIFASWSMARFLAPCAVTVLSDGTLTAEDKAAWSRVLPGMRFVEVEEADELVANRVKTTYPNVWKLRNALFWGRKLIDVHCLDPAPKMILMDSDVLCFRRPDELLNIARNSTYPYAWANDMMYAYPATPEILHEIFGFEVPPRINAGFLLLPNWSDSGFGGFELLEHLIGQILKDGRIPLDHVFIEQMLYAACSTQSPDARVLSDDYAIRRGKTYPDEVLRHYVGARLIRPRYFLEGVPMLCKQIGSGIHTTRSRET